MTWFPNCIVDTILVDFIRAFPILESVTLLSVDICGCIYDQSVNEHDLSAMDGGTLNQQIFHLFNHTTQLYPPAVALKGEILHENTGDQDQRSPVVPRKSI